jgi:predicted ATPase
MLLGGRIEGVPLFLDGLAAYRATGHQLALPYYLGILAHAYTRMGRFKEALDTLQQALETVDANDDRFEEAELHRLKGEALLAQSRDQSDAAEACFQQSLTIARRQKSRAWELRTANSLARLRQNTGRAAEAKALLEELRSSFTEGHSLPDFVDTSALLAELA